MPRFDYTKLNKLAQLLRREGLRVTPQREHIVDYMRGHGRVKASELARELQDKIARNSVYLNLKTLERVGAIYRVSDGTYSLTDYLTHHTHRYTCRLCGFEAKFWNESLEKKLDLFEHFGQFTVEDHFLEFRGLCHKCRDLPQTMVRPRINTRFTKKFGPSTVALGPRGSSGGLATSDR